MSEYEDTIKKNVKEWVAAYKAELVLKKACDRASHDLEKAVNAVAFARDRISGTVGANVNRRCYNINGEVVIIEYRKDKPTLVTLEEMK